MKAPAIFRESEAFVWMRGCLGDTSQSAISTKQHLSSCAKSRPKAFAKSVSLRRANLEKYQIDSLLPLSTNYHPFQPHQISAPAAPTNEISKTDEKISYCLDRKLICTQQQQEMGKFPSSIDLSQPRNVLTVLGVGEFGPR